MFSELNNKISGDLTNRLNAINIFNRSVSYFDVIASTMAPFDPSLRRVQSNDVIIAREQKKGVGNTGNWISYPRDIKTTIFYPSLDPKKYMMFSVLATSVVAELINNLLEKNVVGVKYRDDLLSIVEGKKVSGAIFVDNINSYVAIRMKKVHKHFQLPEHGGIAFGIGINIKKRGEELRSRKDIGLEEAEHPYNSFAAGIEELFELADRQFDEIDFFIKLVKELDKLYSFCNLFSEKFSADIDKYFQLMNNNSYFNAGDNVKVGFVSKSEKDQEMKFAKYSREGIHLIDLKLDREKIYKFDEIIRILKPSAYYDPKL